MRRSARPNLVTWLSCTAVRPPAAVKREVFLVRAVRLAMLFARLLEHGHEAEKISAGRTGHRPMFRTLPARGPCAPVPFLFREPCCSSDAREHLFFPEHFPTDDRDRSLQLRLGAAQIVCRAFQLGFEAQ